VLGAKSYDPAARSTTFWDLFWQSNDTGLIIDRKWHRNYNYASLQTGTYLDKYGCPPDT